MKSKLTKILCLVMGAILLVTGTVAVTLAYLQDKTQTVTNTMTVGKIDIKLDESVVDQYGVKQGTSRTEEGNTYKLIPGQEYTKDPLITVVKGSEPCYVFFGVAIDNKVSAVLDTSKNVIATQLKNNSWLELQNSDKTQVTWADTDGTQYKIYYKSAAVDALSANKTLKTFELFSVSGAANVSTADKATIKVKAFAVQSANLGTPTNAWDQTFKQSAT